MLGWYPCTIFGCYFSRLFSPSACSAYSSRLKSYLSFVVLALVLVLVMGVFFDDNDDLIYFSYLEIEQLLFDAVFRLLLTLRLLLLAR